MPAPRSLLSSPGQPRRQPAAPSSDLVQPCAQDRVAARETQASGRPTRSRMGASLCTRGIAKRRADRADLDGPATSVRAPAEQHRTLGDPRCLRDDERVLARCPLRRPVCGSSLHDPSVPDRSDRSPVLVGRQRRREASGPIRPARPCAGTPGPNRRPEDPQRGPPQSSLPRTYDSAVRPNARLSVRTQTRRSRYGILRLVGWEGASRAIRTERRCLPAAHGGSSPRRSGRDRRLGRTWLWACPDRSRTWKPRRLRVRGSVS